MKYKYLGKKQVWNIEQEQICHFDSHYNADLYDDAYHCFDDTYPVHTCS